MLWWEAPKVNYKKFKINQIIILIVCKFKFVKTLNETMPNVDQIDISLFPNNYGQKHLTFPFVGGSWMYMLLMMSQKREK